MSRFSNKFVAYDSFINSESKFGESIKDKEESLLYGLH